MTDILPVPGRQPISAPAYKTFARSPKKKVPFLVDLAFFESVSRSHIEALHHIHNMVQLKHFGQKRWYGYAAVKKFIQWRRVLEGV